MKFNLTTDKGNYRIDFTLEGKRKRFYPGTQDEVIAKQLVRQMAYEWDIGKFDFSLTTYRIRSKPQPQSQILSKRKEADPTQLLLTLWDKWVENLHLPPSTKNGHYHYVRQAIKKHNPKDSDVFWFIELRQVWSVSTWAGRKSYLKACIKSSIDEGLFAGKNPYQGLKPLKDTTPDRIKPFSPDEITRILKALDSNQFCHPSSGFNHSHYASFVRFLFITGCRLGEATGLTWNCIDFASRTIIIKQALGRDTATSPNKTRKVMKETKTGKSHHIPMNDDLSALLKGIQPSDCSEFVFTGHRGRYIDTASFRRRVWKPLLEKLGIEYRYPYQTRHTVLSAVTTSHGLLAAAKLAGHKNLDMVSRHYARYTDDLSEVLPSLEIVE